MERDIRDTIDTVIVNLQAYKHTSDTAYLYLSQEKLRELVSSSPSPSNDGSLFRTRSYEKCLHDLVNHHIN